jgi:hypothetical protein
MAIPIPGMFLMSSGESRINRNRSQIATQIARQETDAVRNDTLAIWHSFASSAGLFLHFVGLIIESEAFQYPRHMFLHARGTSRRLLCSSEMQQIPFLPSWGERMKGFGQFWVIIQGL